MEHFLKHQLSNTSMSGTATPAVSRVAIVGAGQVGGAAAYALVMENLVGELLLVDNKPDLRDAQVRDLGDVAYACSSATRVRAAGYHEAGQCDLIIITAGTSHHVGQTSGQAMWHNIAIVRNVVNAMRPIRPDAVMLVVSTPCDLLTSLAQKLSHLPAAQVIGSGTFLDSVRLRGMMADRIGVSSNSIHAYVLGVHGDNQVVAWSSATIGGAPLERPRPATLSPTNGGGGGSELHGQLLDRHELERDCAARAESIISTKGSTPFGIASIVASMAASVLLDKRNVRPVSHFQPEFGCCVSLPAVLGRRGIVRTIKMPLDADEERRVAETARKVKAQLDGIELPEA